jgi:tyrosyl-DNA phosphodiesterase-1
MVDLHWLIENCPILLTVPVLCLRGSSSAHPIRVDNILDCFVDMGEERFGTHHCKIAIVFYRSGMRVCITTANFIPEDFTFRTQGIYVQDFPLRVESSFNLQKRRGDKFMGDFESTLVDYLRSVRHIDEDLPRIRLLVCRSSSHSIASW